jgi:rubredoxin
MIVINHDQYQCPLCQFIYDELKGKCYFKVGPYSITMIDLPDDLIVVRCIIRKGLQQLSLSNELPLNVNEENLNKIWKENKNA